jgi:hypothetical protein
MADRDGSGDAQRETLCQPFLAAVPATGAAVSVFVGLHGQSTLCASDDVAARLDEMQFDLGEGPSWEALATRRPVLAPGIRASGHPAWPMFAEALRSDGVGNNVASMYAFPLAVGSLDIGAVDLYSSSVRELTSAQVADVVALATRVTWQVLRCILADEPGEVEDSVVSPYSRREIHQATGMVLAQLGISAADAALLLRAHAFSTGRPVREVASDVVARRMDFGEGSR